MLAIDEAHLLDHDQLESIRLMTNHDMDSSTPFATILVGQPNTRHSVKLGIGCQGPGEAGDEVLVTPVRRAGPEQVTGPRSGGQPGRPPGIRRCDRHHPRRRAADMHCRTPAVAG